MPPVMLASNSKVADVTPCVAFEIISAVSVSFGSGGGIVKLPDGEGKEKFPTGDIIVIVSIGDFRSPPSTKIAEKATIKKEPHTREVP